MCLSGRRLVCRAEGFHQLECGFPMIWQRVAVNLTRCQDSCFASERRASVCMLSQRVSGVGFLVAVAVQILRDCHHQGSSETKFFVRWSRDGKRKLYKIQTFPLGNAALAVMVPFFP